MWRERNSVSTRLTLFSNWLSVQWVLLWRWILSAELYKWVALAQFYTQILWTMVHKLLGLSQLFPSFRCAMFGDSLSVSIWLTLFPKRIRFVTPFLTVMMDLTNWTVQVRTCDLSTKGSSIFISYYCRIAMWGRWISMSDWWALFPTFPPVWQFYSMHWWIWWAKLFKWVWRIACMYILYEQKWNTCTFKNWTNYTSYIKHVYKHWAD